MRAAPNAARKTTSGACLYSENHISESLLDQSEAFFSGLLDVSRERDWRGPVDADVALVPRAKVGRGALAEHPVEFIDQQTHRDVSVFAVGRRGQVRSG